MSRGFSSPSVAAAFVIPRHHQPVSETDTQSVLGFYDRATAKEILVMKIFAINEK